MKCPVKKSGLLIWLAVLAALPQSLPARGEVLHASPLYALSNFTGPVLFGNWPRMNADTATGEIYVVSKDDIQVFNERGMEIYRFNRSLGDRTIYDVAVKKDGSLIFLTSRYDGATGGFSTAIEVGNYRGEPVSTLELKNLPPEFSKFSPGRLLYRDGLLYLANPNSMQIVIVDDDGFCKAAFDLVSLLDLEGTRDDASMGDFGIDREGNILVTVPVLGIACRLTPDGATTFFGRRGSGPGKFGIPTAIVADAAGNYLVADTLRCMIIVFDKDLKYVTEFGGRGSRPGRLIGPRGLVMDTSNKLYVSQPGKRGVSVFQITYD